MLRVEEGRVAGRHRGHVAERLSRHSGRPSQWRHGHARRTRRGRGIYALGAGRRHPRLVRGTRRSTLRRPPLQSWHCVPEQEPVRTGDWLLRRGGRRPILAAFLTPLPARRHVRPSQRQCEGARGLQAPHYPIPQSRRPAGTTTEIARAYGHPDGAVAAYREGLRVAPKDADLFFNLGRAQENTGDINGSIASYQNAVSLTPKLSEAWNNLGVLYNRVGRRIRASRRSARVPGARVFGERPLQLRGRAAPHGHCAEAITALESTTKLDSEQLRRLHDARRGVSVPAGLATR